MGRDEPRDFIDIVVIDVDLKIDPWVQKNVSYVVILRTLLERFAQDDALSRHLKEALEWPVKVIQIAEHIQADHMVDLAAQILDPRVDQALRRKTEARKNFAADVDQRIAGIKSPILDRQIAAGERMIKVAAAAPDIENAIAGTDTARKYLRRLSVSRHFLGFLVTPARI